MTQARRLEPWVSPLLLMAVIFVLSAQADLTSGLGTIDLIGRKVIHFAQYGLLAGLWWRALWPRAGGRRAALLAFVITALYAATDEYHQTLVEGRSGNPIDWAIDCAGAALVTARMARRGGARA